MRFRVQRAIACGISDQRCAAHFGAPCGIQLKAAEISTPSSLPSSRPGNMSLALRIATHNYSLGMGHGAWGIGQTGHRVIGSE
ncbi:MAG: hypothetical protein JGK17_10740 [Microcoleus sp. PH2017_10_PVI_O_A]|uniref:hypothetical protein n=1 Tax=unclassified Microcoleus TaxID=2642155 RepID=UPI001D2CABA4|nr:MULTISPECIES: hypothetical protein [unclassified Microcoleus]MCC3406050.1 hypothetical protein [Microcoleus sp. PH2017_10_PVI_O_A]MCC3460203.1 hypothetical protein [Microcoleus sp. PH2017_11_PCY_U_A]MCC3478626.1 hypothetical protein [Microcoleus sp. PH2017_12_PCY_D_A]MCC3559510.1 hypothetical protein [Microcoleus sp. PH2017_27_LUM_O_A]